MSSKREPIVEELRELVGDIAHGQSIADTARRLESIGAGPDQALANAVSTASKRLSAYAADAGQVAVLLADMMDSPHPTGALVNLTRFIETTGASGAFLNTMTGGQPLREVLATIFGSSQYMSDIIIRNPGNLYWLIEQSTWDRTDTPASYEAELVADTSKLDTLEAKLNASRRYARRMLLKIGVRDLLGLEPVEETAAQLSHLADAIVRVVLRLLWEAAPPTGAPTPDRGFAVLALGKLGGGELNYSSDIDLIYLCDDNDDRVGFYTALARRLTAVLSQVTPEGYLYRVDLRLRPDGDVGPIVNSLSAARIYYENRGRPWEFQAMLKARVIAGDERLGGDFLDSVQSLIFNPSPAYSPVESIAGMRKRIRESISVEQRSFDIKLMEGGIRDIEFIVQSLQLLHGARRTKLRGNNTLTGIEAAHRGKLLKKVERKTLADAYRFFRLVEHRLQMMHQIKTHSIPASESEIALLARRISRGPLGDFSPQSFLGTITAHITNVRLLSDSFFEEKDVPASSLLLLLPQDDAFARDTLEGYGFDDARQAHSILQSLAYGSFPTLVDTNTRAQFQELLPLLLDDLAKSGDPDKALVSFANLAGATRSPAAFYRVMIESQSARKLIRDLIATAPVLASSLAKTMEALDGILEAPEEVLSRPVTDDPSWSALIRSDPVDAQLQAAVTRSMHQRLLAAWVLDARGRSFPDAMAYALTGMAHDLLRGGFDAVINKSSDVAIFAMGSYAVGEPRFASDVDLLVVSDEADLEGTTRAVQRLGRLLGGNVLHLDFRLRGEGANAPLVQSLNFYRDYFERRMSAWERVAYAKCRQWAGDEKLGERFLSVLTPHLMPAFDDDALAQLRALRLKLESLASRESVFGTKRSSGGRYDIEYLCAIGLARLGEPYPLHLTTKERLERLADGAIITIEERDRLVAAGDFYSRIEFVVQLAGRTRTARDNEEEVSSYLDRTFRLLGWAQKKAVRQRMIDVKKGVRACYERTIGTA